MGIAIGIAVGPQLETPSASGHGSIAISMAIPIPIRCVIFAHALWLSPGRAVISRHCQNRAAGVKTARFEVRSRSVAGGDEERRSGPDPGGLQQVQPCAGRARNIF